DYLYADELRGWEADGIVRVEGAFSRTADAPSRYVQDALLDCAGEVWGLLQHDAAVFVCGNAATMAPGVRSALMTIFRDKTSAGEPTPPPGSRASAPPTASWRKSGAADPRRLLPRAEGQHQQRTDERDGGVHQYGDVPARQHRHGLGVGGEHGHDGDADGR